MRAQGQHYSNLRCKIVPLNQPVYLDTLMVYAPSLSVSADTCTWTFDQSSNVISVLGRVDSAKVCYRVFPFALHTKKSVLDLQQYREQQYYSTKEHLPRYGAMRTPQLEKEELFSFGNFNKSGNFTRGIAVGNAQDAFVNSSLNLQLDGYLTDKIRLTGALSDQNIPIQPNGYTQNLQQFDRVYLELAQEGTFKVTAGDYVLKNRHEAYFLKYLKNVQGLQGQYYYKMSAKDTAHTMVGISFGKGKFSSMELLGSAIASSTAEQTLQEGMLGPYRLVGPNKERFVQVIANSEKIYLDGRLLTRGFNNDYTIDYNSGEVRFTANVLITKYARVRIDFEYSDRNYARNNIQLSHKQDLGKLSWQLDYYSEKDNAQSPLAISLNNTDKQRLSEVGDTLERAYVQSGDSVGYAAGALLYRLVKDTLVQGIHYANIYVYSSDPVKASYLVSFTYVGLGNGNYEPSADINNGRVYEWLAPQGGLKRGSYLPQRIVPTPKLKSMWTSSLKYQRTTTEAVYAEIALSHNDLNLYSPLDDGDNRGKALKIGYENKGRKLLPQRKLQYLAGIDFELLDRDFTPIDRFRSVDFDRDWNASPTTPTNNLYENAAVKAEDKILSWNLGLKDSLTYVKFTQVLRNKDNDAKGRQNKLEWRKKYKRLAWDGSYFDMHNDLDSTYARWQKIKSDLSLSFNTLKQGYIYEREDNRQYQQKNDSITRSYQNFYLHRFYIHSGEGIKIASIKWYNEQRQDYIPYEGSMRQNSFSRTQNVSVSTNINKNHQLGITTTLRHTENQLRVLNSLPPRENTLLTRLDWSSTGLNKSLKSDLTFTTSTGRELRREYLYIPVPTGQGNFTWRDDNADGIQQLNEFYEALNFDEKNFLKVFVPTSQYVSSYASSYIYRLNVAAPPQWRLKTGWKKQAAKFSTTSYYTLDKSSLKEDIAFRINPLYGTINDTSLLFANANFRNTLFWNRQNSNLGAEYTFNHQTQKQFLSNGYEARKNLLHQAILRKNIGKALTLRLHAELTHRESASDYLGNRNFKVKGYKVRPELAFQPSTDFRITLSSALGNKKNLLGVSSEKSSNVEVSLETRYSKVSTRAIQFTLRYNNISYNASTNTPLAYEMLEALQPGNNYYWNVSYTQKILNGLQISINYDGRKTTGLPIIHIGRLQATALF